LLQLDQDNVTLDWMLHVPFLAVMMVAIYVFPMFHKETAMKENNACGRFALFCECGVATPFFSSKALGIHKSRTH